jgi:isoquinoline 1-oxidoreductase alpha subunit
MVKLKVNGVDRSFEGDPDMPLLWYRRDTLGMTGTKFGCRMALCGACTVHKNGKAIRSSITPMSGAAVAAETGQFELYKTTHHFDGTVVNSQWLG